VQQRCHDRKCPGQIGAPSGAVLQSGGEDVDRRVLVSALGACRRCAAVGIYIAGSGQLPYVANETGGTWGQATGRTGIRTLSPVGAALADLFDSTDYTFLDEQTASEPASTSEIASAGWPA
jgi:hypothetical protein